MFKIVKNESCFKMIDILITNNKMLEVQFQIIRGIEINYDQVVQHEQRDFVTGPV